MNIYEVLKELNINYTEIEHKAVYTIEEAIKEDIPSKINGIECKNLFVKYKNNYFLIFVECNKRVNLKELAKYLCVQKLSFASESELKNILNLDIGSVTPLGIVNDKDNLVTLVIDSSLKNNNVLVHPNINTKTISLSYDDLLSIIKFLNHKYIEYSEV